MPKSSYDSSLQSQNPISQAQNSVEKVHRAVSQAQTHPTEQTISQAENAIAKAERAVDQAGKIDNPAPVEMAEEMLAEEKQALQELKQSGQVHRESD